MKYRRILITKMILNRMAILNKLPFEAQILPPKQGLREALHPPPPTPKKKASSNKGQALFSCGGPTRTGDLQVMSLASYQLLHPAMFLVCECKGRAFF